MSKKPSGLSAAAAFERPLLLTKGQLSFSFYLSQAGRLLLLFLTGTSVVAVFLIFVFIIREAIPFIREEGLRELFTGLGWYPARDPHEFGGLPLIVGSVYVTVGAILIAGPFGLVTAAFLSDIVPFWFRQIVKPVVELLAAIPSVAYGFFAILVFAPFLQEKLGIASGANILNASCLLAAMALPTIVSVAEDAMTAAGSDLRAASYALGATRAETVFKTVIPAAHNGIIAALMLGIMRAIGETMVVWMAAGNAPQIPAPWWDITVPVRTITATVAAEMAETPHGSVHFHGLFALGLMLLVFTFIMNLVTEYFLRRVKKKSGGMKI